MFCNVATVYCLVYDTGTIFDPGNWVMVTMFCLWMFHGLQFSPYLLIGQSHTSVLKKSRSN